MSLNVVILAAGKGTRMHSHQPKVLHEIAGKPMLHHVVDTARALEPEKILIICGHQAAAVMGSMQDDSMICWVEQQQQLGTGHAVAQALPHLSDADNVLILYGDVPLIEAQTLNRLIQQLDAERLLSVLTVSMPDPTGYGRIVRSDHGAVIGIVEEADATPVQRQISEVNTGIMAFATNRLKVWVSKLNADNKQNEYYLTDVVAMAAERSEVITYEAQQVTEVFGVNNRVQLATAERYYQQRQAEQLMLAGVTLKDPARVDIRGLCCTGMDCSIDVNVVLEGVVKLGDRVSIEPNCIISNCVIGDDTTIKASSCLEETTIGEGCNIGPYARTRPGTVLSNHVKIGNFVETKQATIGAHSKVNHLSYIGDAMLGESVNIGAGAITCNYDGANKHQTIIEDDAFIGSNTALVAPVSIGKQATIGAGSTITKSVESQQLALTRSKQAVIDDWKRPIKNTQD